MVLLFIHFLTFLRVGRPPLWWAADKNKMKRIYLCQGGRAWFNAPDLKSGNHESGSWVQILPLTFYYASMAQLAEQLICNQQVVGSSPTGSFYLALWLSWLERRPVTAEVEGSSPFRVAAAHWSSGKDIALSRR